MAITRLASLDSLYCPVGIGGIYDKTRREATRENLEEAPFDSAQGDVPITPIDD